MIPILSNFFASMELFILPGKFAAPGSLSRIPSNPPYFSFVQSDHGNPQGQTSGVFEP